MDEDGAAAAIAFSSEERYLPPMMGLPREVKIRAAILPACSRMVVKCSEWLRPVPRPDNRGKSALGRYSAITYNATTARRYRDFSSKPSTFTLSILERFKVCLSVCLVRSGPVRSGPVCTY